MAFLKNLIPNIATNAIYKCNLQTSYIIHLVGYIMGNKEAGLAVGGTASGGLAAGGIALMVLGGPVGIVAGGVMLGGGISGGVNTVQQGVSDKDDFNYGSFALNAGIGAASGLITGGAGAIGANIATNVAKSALQEVAIITTSSVVGGAVSGGASTIATNAAEDRDLTDNLASSILIGGLAGGVGSGIGQATSKLQTQVIQGISKSATDTVKVVAGTAGGAVAGGLSGMSVQLLNNLAKYGEISNQDLSDFLTQQGATQAQAEEMIEELYLIGYLFNGKITDIFKGRILFISPQFRNYERMIEDLFKNAFDVMKDLGMSVVTGIVVGGISGAASSANQIRRQQKLNQASQSKQKQPVQKQQSRATDTKNSQQKTPQPQAKVETQPKQTTKPIQNLIESKQSTDPSLSTKPTNSVKPINLTDLTEKAMPTSSAKPNQPAKPTQPVGSTETIKQTFTTQPNLSGQPTHEETIKMQSLNAGKVKNVYHSNGTQDVKKELASTQQVKNYKLLERLGTGVPLTKIEGNVIYMEKGIPLNEAIPNLDIKQINKVESDLNRIQQIHQQNNIQHTDIKPANAVIIGQGENIEVRLIDNDYVTEFGKTRITFTDGNFTTVQNEGEKITVNQNTDKKGMDWIKKDLLKAKKILFAKQCEARVTHQTASLNTAEANV